MKTVLRKMLVVTVMSWLVAFGTKTATIAAEFDGPAADRLQRLERRLDELAARQEQFTQQMRAGGQRPEGILPQRNPARPRLGAMAGPGQPEMLRPLPAAGFPGREPMARDRKGLHNLLGLICLGALVCNILLAIWIFTDIRKRGEGSGIFIALALIAGIPTAIIYSLVRIGDRKS